MPGLFQPPQIRLYERPVGFAQSLYNVVRQPQRGEDSGRFAQHLPGRMALQQSQIGSAAQTRRAQQRQPVFNFGIDDKSIQGV